MLLLTDEEGMMPERTRQRTARTEPEPPGKSACEKAAPNQTVSRAPRVPYPKEGRLEQSLFGVAANSVAALPNNDNDEWGKVTSDALRTLSMGAS